MEQTVYLFYVKQSRDGLIWGQRPWRSLCGPGFWVCLAWTSPASDAVALFHWNDLLIHHDVQSAHSRHFLSSVFSTSLSFLSLLFGWHPSLHLTGCMVPSPCLFSTLKLFENWGELFPQVKDIGAALSVFVHLFHVIALSLSDVFVFVFKFIQTLWIHSIYWV